MRKLTSSASREIPSDAYALVVGETPSEYWHIRPLTIALGLLTLLLVLRTHVAPRCVAPVATDDLTTP